MSHPRLCLRTSLGDRAVSRGSPGPIGTHTVRDRRVSPYLVSFFIRVWPNKLCGSVLCSNTSSTAQGGGGSFKNRKPIGEIGCCESGMAERIHWWTGRCLRSPFFLSLSLTIYLPTYLSSMYLSIYRSISLSLSFIYLSYWAHECPVPARKAVEDVLKDEI